MVKVHWLTVALLLLAYVAVFYVAIKLNSRMVKYSNLIEAYHNALFYLQSIFFDDINEKKFPAESVLELHGLLEEIEIVHKEVKGRGKCQKKA